MKIENLELKILLLTASTAMFFAPNTARAATVSLGISPPIIQIEVKPPASLDAPITIQNLGDETVTLRAGFQPFTAADSEDGQVRYITDTEKLDLADPLIFQRIQLRDNGRKVDLITLGPQQEKLLKLHIDIPKDEALSDYYFSVLFVSSTGENSEEANITGSSAVGAIGTNVLLSVGPKGKAKGFLKEFSAPAFLEHGPVPFTIRAHNSGARVLTPTGRIEITNMFGQTVGAVDLLPVNILAGTTRAIPDSLQQSAISHQQSAKPQTISNFKFQISNSPKALWPELFLMGPYRAKLTLLLSDEGPLFTKTITFLAVPTQLLIGFLAALVIVLIVARRVRQKIKR